MTRPSRISGPCSRCQCVVVAGEWGERNRLPVCSATSLTVSPACRSALAVPPVDSSSTPCVAKNLPSATSPVLSETLRIALVTRRRDSVLPRIAAWDVAIVGGSSGEALGTQQQQQQPPAAAAAA